MIKKYRFLFLLAFIAGSLFAQNKDDKGKQPEKYRPLIHFSPAAGWMSDPNGLVYLDGEYHLCYQHITAGVAGTCWGHAVSTDLLNWQHMPIAILPDSLGFIYSGCSVADLKNTSGLGTLENPPLLALFTYYNGNAKPDNNQTQALAFSTDKGRTWTKYSKNPVIPNPGLTDFRDPHVFWSETYNRWIMALSGGAVIQFYASKDCLSWDYLSEFGKDMGSHVGPWECPDLFPVKVEGSNQIKWVLLVSVVDFTDTPNRLSTSTQYFIGDFDGKNFTTEQRDTCWLDYGKDNYAGITYDNAPGGRRIFVGWMHSHQYAGAAQGSTTKTWSGAATFPRELKVVSTDNGYRLQSKPIKEIKKLYNRTVKIKPAVIDGSYSLSDKIPFDKAPLNIMLSFENPGFEKLPLCYGVRLSNQLGQYIQVEYNKSDQCFYVDRTSAVGVPFHDQFASIQKAPYKATEKLLNWQLLIDVASLELFVADHKIVFTDVFFPTEPFNTIELITKSGTIKLKKGSITSLHSVKCINP